MNTLIENPNDAPLRCEQSLVDVHACHRDYLDIPTAKNWIDLCSAIECARKSGATEEEIGEAIQKSASLYSEEKSDELMAFIEKVSDANRQLSSALHKYTGRSN